MKQRILLFCAAAAALLAGGCTGNLAYDTSEGINTELTLFEDEISVPIGSIGPLKLDLVLDKVKQMEGIGALLGDFIKVDENGLLMLDDKGELYKANIYEIAKRIEDTSTPTSLNVGSKSAYMGGMASVLGFINLSPVNQKVTITASNPLWVDVPVHGNAYSIAMAADYTESWRENIEALSNFTLKSGTNETLLATVTPPADLTDRIASVTIEDLTLDLPAEPVNKINSTTGNVCFSFNYYYTTGIAVGEKFDLTPINGPISGVSAPLGQFRLKKCRLTLDLENSLPLTAIIDSVRVLKNITAEDGTVTQEEDLNITIGPEKITLTGGSLQNPSVNPITLEVEAAEGTIPDIEGLRARIRLTGQSGLGSVPISTGQGIYVKSSSARVSGGITIPEGLLK